MPLLLHVLLLCYMGHCYCMGYCFACAATIGVLAAYVVTNCVLLNLEALGWGVMEVAHSLE